MVIVMDMESGMREFVACDAGYDDEVLKASWTEVPQVEPRLEEVASARHEPNEREIACFLARVYAAQE